MLPARLGPRGVASASAAIKGPEGPEQPRGVCVPAGHVSQGLQEPLAMGCPLLCLLLLGLHAVAGATVAPPAPGPSAGPPAPGPSAGPSGGPPTASLLQALLAQLEPSAAPGLSCAELQAAALPRPSRLPPLPRALAQAALVLVLRRMGCGAQAAALERALRQQLDAATAQLLLQRLAQLPQGPGRRRLQQLLLQLLPLGAGVPVAPCAGFTAVDDAQLWGPAAGRRGSLAQATATCTRLQAACAGVAPAGPAAFVAVQRQGAQLLPAPGARAWLQRCSRAPRGRGRRAGEEPCSPPGEREAHRVLEWLPGVSTLYNLGTSIYFAYEGCERLASERAWEAALDLGYDGLAALSAGVGGPVAYGVHLGLQPGLKAGVRALIRYYLSEEEPSPAPTAHAGPVRIV